MSQVWWFMNIKLTLRKWRKEDHVFEVEPRPCYKTQSRKQIEIYTNKASSKRTSGKMLCYIWIMEYLLMLEQKQKIKI